MSAKPQPLETPAVLPLEGSAAGAPAVARATRAEGTTPIAGPGRPKNYKLADGSVIPSVTTITKRFGDSQALIAWANREGLAGRDLNEARDAAADAGHVAHQWIQDEIHGRPLTSYSYTDDETIEKARRALAAFKEWASKVNLVILATEIPLVSQVYRFGGTLDAIGELLWPGAVSRVLALCDWKTGNRCYPEHVVQQAAYRELLREEARRLDRDPITVPQAAVLIRLDKETGLPSARIFESDALDLGWTWFSRCRELYELDKDVSKLVNTKPKKRGKAA